MLLRYAREHHFQNPTFFVDDGVSGVTYDRPGFQAMLAEIEAGRVAVCISKDLSRLGRNSALTGLYTNFTFPQYGVRYIAINDNFDTINPNSTDNETACTFVSGLWLLDLVWRTDIDSFLIYYQNRFYTHSIYHRKYGFLHKPTYDYGSLHAGGKKGRALRCYPR